MIGVVHSPAVADSVGGGAEGEILAGCFLVGTCLAAFSAGALLKTAIFARTAFVAFFAAGGFEATAFGLAGADAPALFPAAQRFRCAAAIYFSSFSTQRSTCTRARTSAVLLLARTPRATGTRLRRYGRLAQQILNLGQAHDSRFKSSIMPDTFT